MFDDATLAKLIGFARDVSQFVAREYYTIEAEDIEGFLYEHMCSNSDRYADHIDVDGWIWAVMYAEGVRYARTQIVDFMYHSSQYIYTPQEVRGLLAKAWTEDTTFTGVVAIGDETVAVLDLVTAFGKLRHDQQVLINRKIAGEKLTDSERKAYYRATEYMTRLLNRHFNRRDERVDGIGTRRAISNAHAQAVTGDQENGV
ncbi:hypothetical protein ABZ470_31890 [Streptosporangium sp. NPDC020072]|uniref:hypothetical protein n=1 Tax=Streptosporangium sp. NPDC020072 TaxID=3154788 RepID=UPI0034409AC1